MLSVIPWALSGMAIGAAGYPLALFLAGSRRDIAPFLAYPIGLALSSYVVWLLGISGLAPFTSAVSWAALLVSGAVGLGLCIRRAAPPWPSRSELSLIGAAIALYLATLALWAVVRGLDPSAASTEKPMDMAFLSSLIRSTSLPPPDPWLSGYPINYYYMGYLAAAMQAKMTGIPNTQAFNLALANYFALAACALTAAGTALAPSLAKRVLLRGVLTAGVVLLPGNLYAATELIRRPQWVIASDWWQGIGWNATRVIVDALPGGPWPNITEFPFFSFLLGDMHPHVMALPLAASACAVLAALIQDDTVGRERWGVVAWLLGSLYPWNSWDLPTMLILVSFSTAVLLRQPGRTWLEVGLFRLGFLTLGAVLFYLPFWLTFRPPVAGPGAPLPPELARLPIVPALARYFGPVIYDHTRMEAFLTVNGVFLLPIAWWLTASYLKQAARDAPRALVWSGAGLLAVGAGPVLGMPILGLLAVLLVLACRILFDAQRPATERFMACLVAVSMMLFLACELIFIQDVFHNRMNTIFKFYYQAWLLLGIVAAGLLAAWLGTLRRPISAEAALPQGRNGPSLSENAVPRGVWDVRVGTALAIAVLLMGMAYPALSIPKKLLARGWHGLDAASWIAAVASDEWKAIQWLSRNAEPGAVVLEATGSPYSYAARISTYTGIPTLLGWANHERQWHAGDDRALAEIARREQEVAAFYRGNAPGVVRKYGVSYVVYGDFEQGRLDPRIDYSGQLQRLQAAFPIAFASGNTYIFRVGP